MSVREPAVQSLSKDLHICTQLIELGGQEKREMCVGHLRRKKGTRNSIILIGETKSNRPV